MLLSGSLYLKVFMVLFFLFILIIDSCVLIFLRFLVFVFAFVIKYNDVFVFYKIFGNLFFVGIFCIWSKYILILLLYIFVVSFVEIMVVGNFFFCFLCSVLWLDLL